MDDLKAWFWNVLVACLTFYQLHYRRDRINHAFLFAAVEGLLGGTGSPKMASLFLVVSLYSPPNRGTLKKRHSLLVLVGLLLFDLACDGRLPW